MKLKYYYALLLLYLTISSSLIETKNIIKSNNFAYRRFQIKNSVKTKGFFSALKNGFNKVINLTAAFKWVYKTEPVDAEGKSSEKDKMQGYILFILEIIRAFNFNPLSVIAAKILDSYDSVEMCVNKSTELMQMYHDIFGTKKDDLKQQETEDAEYKAEMMVQQEQIVDFVLMETNKFLEKKISTKYDRCSEAQKQISNSSKYIDLLFKNFLNGAADTEENYKLKSNPILNTYVENIENSLKLLKEKFLANSEKRVKDGKYDNKDDEKWCLKYGKSYLCMQDLIEIRAQVLQSIATTCALNYRKGMRVEEYIQVHVCESIDILNSEEGTVKFLRKYYKRFGGGYVSIEYDILDSLKISKYGFFLSQYSLGTKILEVVGKLFDYYFVISNPTMIEMRFFITEKLQQFEKGIDCTIFQDKTWLKYVFRMFSLARKIVKSIATIITVFKKCVQPVYAEAKAKAIAIKNKIKEKIVETFHKYKDEAFAKALLNLTRAKSVDDLALAYHQLISDNKQIKQIASEEVDKEIPDADKINSEDGEDSEDSKKNPEVKKIIQELKDLKKKVEEKSSKGGAEKSADKVLGEVSLPKELTKDLKEIAEKSFDTAATTIKETLNQSIEENFDDLQKDPLTQATEQALKEGNWEDKIKEKVQQKVDALIEENKSKFIADPWEYTAKMAVTAINCASEPALCAARSAANLLVFAVKDEINLNYEEFKRQILNKEFVKEQPLILQDFAVFVLDKLKDKALNKAEEKTNKAIDKSIGTFKEVEIKGEIFKDIKMLGTIYDNPALKGLNVLAENARKLPVPIIKGSISVGKFAYEFNEFVKQQDEKRASFATNPNTVRRKWRLSSSNKNKSKDNYIPYPESFPEQNRLYLNFQVNKMLSAEAANEVPTIKTKVLNVLKIAKEKGEKIKSYFDDIVDFSDDLRIIFPSLNDFFNKNMKELKKFVIQLIGIGPFNLLFYGKAALDFFLLLRQALSTDSVKIRFRLYGKLIGIVIGFFKTDRFKILKKTFLSFFEKKKTLRKHRKN